MTENVLGLIPARGGSKGIPKKNITDVAGRPLIDYSISAGLDSTVVDSVVVSTDDNEIAEVAKEHGARVPFIRPDKLSTDEAPTKPVVGHALEELAVLGEQYDAVVLLQPTSPLRTGTHIDRAYEIYVEERVDSLISAYPTTETRWQPTPDGAVQLNYQGSNKRRQDREPEYVINGAVYITDVEEYHRAGELVAGKTAIYEMDEIDSVDVDTPFDIWLAEQILMDWK